MRRLLAALALAAAVLAVAAPSAHASGAACALSQDANGNLVVTGSGLEANYYWGWGLYAGGVTPPAGYTPWLDYGYFNSDATGNFMFTMNTVAVYEALPGGPYPLKFSVFGLRGSKDLIGTNRLSNDSGYLTTCVSPGP